MASSAATMKFISFFFVVVLAATRASAQDLNPSLAPAPAGSWCWSSWNYYKFNGYDWSFSCVVNASHLQALKILSFHLFSCWFSKTSYIAQFTYYRFLSYNIAMIINYELIYSYLRAREIYFLSLFVVGVKEK
jgi:hypothetical protein